MWFEQCHEFLVVLAPVQFILQFILQFRSDRSAEVWTVRDFRGLLDPIMQETDLQGGVFQNKFSKRRDGVTTPSV